MAETAVGASRTVGGTGIFKGSQKVKIISHSVGHTIAIGRLIARYAGSGSIICLFGPLGSGKTVLTKGIACGLGIDRESVISPSFVLMRQYSHLNRTLYHFDLYRLNRPRDILALGYEEYFYGNGITVIEWPQKLGFLMPDEFIKVELRLGSDSRRTLILSAVGRRYRDSLEKIHEDIRH